MRFQRASLPAQVAATLRQRIAARQWKQWLPTERELCETMAVSRRTLRVALDQLKREGLVEATAGLGTQIVGAAARKPKATREETGDIGLLMPEPVDLQRPYLTVWVEKLQVLVGEAGHRLHVHTGRHYFEPGGARALARLIDQAHCAMWVLAFSNAAVQRWFEQQKIPTIVSGATHPGLGLPCVGLDNQALCRHAAGTLLAHGHRRIALLSEVSPSAGALEAEAGFRSALSDAQRGLEPLVLRGQSEPAVVRKTLERLLRSSPAPTALIVLNPLLYLTAATTAMALGKRIPRDLSLVTTYGDPFLSYVCPAPARYRYNADLAARKLFRVIQQILRHEPVAQPRLSLVPTCVPGESVGRAPAD